jgi:Heparinase II/III-like protein/Heparinase II/III N-terminus
VFGVHKSNVKLRGDVDWSANPEESRSFASNLHRFTWIDPLIFAYRTEGDLDALRQAADLSLDWVADHPQAPRNATDGAAWGDKITADRAPYMAFISRAGECEGVTSNRERKLLSHAVGQQAAFLAAKRNYVATNHGLFMDLGLIFLTESAKSPEQAAEWRGTATDRFRSTLLSRVIPSEGLWLEHSTSYHFVALEKLKQFLDATGEADPRLTGLLARMEDVGAWLVEPDGKIVQFGESDLDEGDEAFVAEGEDRNGMLTLTKSGLVVVRSGDSYLAITAGYHNQTHKQSDDLSFDLFERGHRIVSDTGLFHKDRDETFAYTSSNRAHSTLTADGVGWPRDDESAYGSGIVAAGEGDGWFAIEARNPLLERQGVKHGRLYLYRPGDALVIADTLEASAPHLYTRRFHFGPDVKVRSGSGGLSLRAGGLDGAMTFNSVVATPELSLVKGQEIPIQGFTFPAFRESVPRFVAGIDTYAQNDVEIATLGFTERLNAYQSTAGRTRLIEIDGREPRSVEITRAGDELFVSEAERP